MRLPTERPNGALSLATDAVAQRQVVSNIVQKSSNIQIQTMSQLARLDLNKKSFSKQKTIQNFTIDTQGFRKTKNENPPTWETGVTS